MKKNLILFLVVFSSFCLFAQRNPIVIHKGGAIDDRSGTHFYPDMPAAYYEYDIKTQEITIDGGGVVSYYDVEISSPVTNTVEISRHLRHLQHFLTAHRRTRHHHHFSLGQCLRGNIHIIAWSHFYARMTLEFPDEMATSFN